MTTPEKTADKTAATTAEAQLAKSNAQKAEVLAEQKEREKWMPTPTQEENDQVALGNTTIEKKPDGSPIEQTPEQQMAAGKKKPEETRQVEAKPSGGYSTRSSHSAG